MNKKLIINAGLSAPASEYDRLIFYVDHFMQGGHNQTQGGVLYRHSLLKEDENLGIDIAAGAFYRWNDAIIPVIKLNYYKLNIGLSYDTNISKLKTASQYRGGFEVTVNSYLNIRNPTQFKCPRGSIDTTCGFCFPLSPLRSYP